MTDTTISEAVQQDANLKSAIANLRLELARQEGPADVPMFGMPLTPAAKKLHDAARKERIIAIKAQIAKLEGELDPQFHPDAVRKRREAEEKAQRQALKAERAEMARPATHSTGGVKGVKKAK